MPIDPGRLAALFVVALAIIAVPGPSVLFVVSRGVTLGRRAAMATVVGNEAGLLVQISAVAVGLGPVVAQSIAVYTAIKIVGAAYLIYLGVRAFRHRGDLDVGANPTVPSVPTRRILRQGFVMGASNPKSFLLFAAILPQFAEPAAGRMPLQLFLLGVVCVAIAFASDSVWALLAGTARTWLSGSPRRLRALGGTAGVVMVGLGVRIAVTGRSD